MFCPKKFHLFYFNTQSVFFVVSEYNQPRMSLLEALAHENSSDVSKTFWTHAKLTLNMDKGAGPCFKSAHGYCGILKGDEKIELFTVHCFC